MSISNKKARELIGMMEERSRGYAKAAREEWRKPAGERDESYRQFSLNNKAAYDHCASMLREAIGKSKPD